MSARAMSVVRLRVAADHVGRRGVKITKQPWSDALACIERTVARALRPRVHRHHPHARVEHGSERRLPLPFLPKRRFTAVAADT